MQTTNRTDESDPKIEDDPDAARMAAIAALEREGVPAGPIHVVMALVEHLAAGGKP